MLVEICEFVGLLIDGEVVVMVVEWMLRFRLWKMKEIFFMIVGFGFDEVGIW